MSFERARESLSDTRFAELRSVDETGSTNADMRGLLGESTKRQPIVLLADHQSAGRGRLDRGWEAPPGSSILMTIGLPMDDIPVESRTLLTMALSLAMNEAIRKAGIDAVSIKWPNDLVVTDEASGNPSPRGYRKVAGVLAEAIGLDGVDYAILGIGLNVNWDDMPGELAEVATSLSQIAGVPVDRDDLVGSSLRDLDSRWLPMLETDPAGLVSAYLPQCSTIGRPVRIAIGDTTRSGTAVSVTETGALVLDENGDLIEMTAGDITHLRFDG